MNIYIFKSDLFPGERRKIISNFPLPISDLIDIVNKDNNYIDDIGMRRRWYFIYDEGEYS